MNNAAVSLKVLLVSHPTENKYARMILLYSHGRKNPFLEMWMQKQHVSLVY
jgi:hypothetical protein